MASFYHVLGDVHYIRFGLINDSPGLTTVGIEQSLCSDLSIQITHCCQRCPHTIRTGKVLDAGVSFKFGHDTFRVYRYLDEYATLITRY